MSVLDEGLRQVSEIYQDSLDKIKGSLDGGDCELLPEKVLDELESYVCQYPITQRDKILALEDKIDNSLGADIRILYNIALVMKLYSKGVNRILEQNLPASVAELLDDDFSRILKLAVNKNEKYLTFRSQLFLSYIEKICFKSFPVGVEDLSASGIPRSLVFKQNFIDGMKLARLMIKMGGVNPMFELHYNPHRLRLFNEKGWEETLKRAAEMLLVKKEIKGVFGAAWWFDPSLEEVSPEITFMQKTCMRAGGDIYFYRSTKADVKNALMTSKVRRKAYEEGRYSPTSYMMILPRAELLSFFSLDGIT